MPKKITCDVCSSEMVEEKKTYGKGRSGKYRIRRMKCSNLTCDYKTTIYAGGMRDVEWEPLQAMQEVDKIFKQEERNRN